MSDQYNGAIIVTNFIAVVAGLSHVGIAIPNIAIILQAKAAGAILFQVINRKFKVTYDEYNPFLEVKELEPTVEIKGVTFAYPTRPEIKVLDNFSITFEAGKTTAIVGATGSGKSTILELILRFYDLSQVASTLEESL